MLRILLADDHEIFREALQVLLEREGLDVVAGAADGREAVRLAQQLQPDFAILDLAMPMLNGLDAAGEIRRAVPKIRIILLTMYDDTPHVRQALDAGINGYVLKTQARRDLLQAIAAVTQGGRYLSPGISQAVADAYASSGRRGPDVLTPRERQVLQLITEGKPTKEIAYLLGIAFKTAESHRIRIIHKLGVQNTAHLVRYAMEHGLVQS